MLRLEFNDKGLPVPVADTADRWPVYLDNCSIIELAKNDSSVLRSRFTAAIRSHGTMLFSVVSGVEAAGSQDGSARRIRTFLAGIGPCWVPVHASPFQIAKNEAPGNTFDASISSEWLKAFLVQWSTENPENVVGISAEETFRLDLAMEWAERDYDRVKKMKEALEVAYKGWYAALRSERDKILQQPNNLPFDPDRPATSVVFHLRRRLAEQAKSHQHKDHDGADFCHAVIAASYASLATLDGPWKKRIEALPIAGALARIYHPNDLSILVSDLEQLGGRTSATT